MPIRALIVALAAVTLIAAAIRAESEQAVVVEKLKLLLIDGQNNHNWKSTTPVMVKALEATGRFAVTVSTTPPAKSPAEAWAQWAPEFFDYHVVVSNYNGELWPEPVREDFVEFVSSGGGFVVIHAANNSFGEWEEYNKMIGLGGWGGRNEKSGPYLYYLDNALKRDTAPGRGGSHGPQEPFAVDIRVADHPVTAGMPAKWMHARDELYSHLRGPAENVSVLATSYSPQSKRHEPMIMTIEYGGGRVFHTPMGHADYSMKCVGFQTTLARGAEWAATGKVTLPIPANFPTETETRSAE